MRMRAAIVGCTLVALVGCASALTLPPVRSAAVVEHSAERISQEPAPSRSLTSQQIKDVSSWFLQHGEGWSSSVASYVPSLEIRLEHKDDVSVVNILSSMVVVNNHSGQFVRKASLEDIRKLKAAIGVKGA